MCVTTKLQVRFRHKFYSMIDSKLDLAKKVLFLLTVPSCVAMTLDVSTLRTIKIFSTGNFVLLKNIFG